MNIKNAHLESGWITTARIEVKKNSDYEFINEWKCNKSNEELNEEFLIVSRKNCNGSSEIGELWTYNRNSSPAEYERVWIRWDKLKEIKRKEIMQIAKVYNLNVSFL